jgi:hypothetical protein
MCKAADKLVADLDSEDFEVSFRAAALLDAGLTGIQVTAVLMQLEAIEGEVFGTGGAGQGTGGDRDA